MLGLSLSNNYTKSFTENTFYDNYMSLLDAKGISNMALSKKLGFGRNRMKFWRNGTKPSAQTLISLAEYFNVSIDFLIGMEY